MATGVSTRLLLKPAKGVAQLPPEVLHRATPPLNTQHKSTRGSRGSLGAAPALNHACFWFRELQKRSINSSLVWSRIRWRTTSHVPNAAPQGLFFPSSSLPRDLGAVSRGPAQAVLSVFSIKIDWSYII